MPDPAHSNRQYLVNILWSWTSFISLIVAGAIVTPLLIRRLGTAQFGVWALASSFVEYLWLADVGIRPATVTLTAQFRALSRTDDLNSLLNTSLFCSTSIAVVLLAVVWPSAHRIGAALHITHPTFPFLLRMTALAWALALVSNVFAATIEGLQRFDLSNRITIAATLARSITMLILVLSGRGLREMGIALAAFQSLTFALLFVYWRRLERDIRFARRYVTRHMVWEIFNYSRQVISAVVAARFSQGTVPILIARSRSVQFITYFTQSQKILDYAADSISRIGLVTAPRVSDWFARGYTDKVVAIARIGNRYCVTLWGALASFLLVYGGDLYRLWINAEFGARAAVLVPILLFGYTFWMGQFISAAILMGIARYQAYSATLLVESLLTAAAFAVILPAYGLAAAVAAMSILMFLSRCVTLSYIFCRVFNLRQGAYLADIFFRPLLLIGGVVGCLTALKRFVVPGNTWTQLIAAGLFSSSLYCGVAFLFILDQEHRALLIRRLSSWGSLQKIARHGET